MGKYDVDIYWEFAKSIKGIEAASAREAELIALQMCQKYNSLSDDRRTRQMAFDGFVSCADSYEVAAVCG